MGDQLPTGQLSVVPWRRTGVKYTNNEAYFDVIEEIDAIIDKSGTVLLALKAEAVCRSNQLEMLYLSLRRMLEVVFPSSFRAVA